MTIHQTADEVRDAVALANYGELPGTAVLWLEIPYDGTYDAYRAAPDAICFRGAYYGKSSHNSDTGRICYRTDKALGWAYTRKGGK